jgi:ligand-binding sensor domain-containing protein
MELPYYLSAITDNTGHLWMVTYNEGVWKYDGKHLFHYPIKDGETDVLLFTIYKDNSGTLWLGTHNAGAYIFNGHSFQKFGL